MKSISKNEVIALSLVGASALLSVIGMTHTINNYEDKIEELEAKITQLEEDRQLDPCPVCDGHNTHIYHDEEYDISIKCEDCGTTFGFYQDMKDALAVWNNVKG